MEFLHGDNFVQAHVRAGLSLLQQQNSPVVCSYILYYVLQRVLLNHSLMHECRLEKRILYLMENQPTISSFSDRWYIK